MNENLYGAIELGGTKINCLVATGADNVVERLQLPTTTPEETLPKVVDFFKNYLPLKGVGVGSFGPLSLAEGSPHFGSVLKTPKAGWSGAAIHSYFVEKLGCPVYIDTDVNAAGLAEQQLGAAKGLNNVIYTTVGTGIGSGAILNGVSLKGDFHPEMGHVELSRDADDKEGYESCCAFHENCAEGLASGSAVMKRWGQSLIDVADDHPAWQLEAKYLAKYAHMLILTYSPEKLVFGGGVSTEKLLVKVRDELYPMLNGYVQMFSSREDLDNYIVLPDLGSEAGPIGSLLLTLGK